MRWVLLTCLIRLHKDWPRRFVLLKDMDRIWGQYLSQVDHGWSLVQTSANSYCIAKSKLERLQAPKENQWRSKEMDTFVKADGHETPWNHFQESSQWLVVIYWYPHHMFDERACYVWNFVWYQIQYQIFWQMALRQANYSSSYRYIHRWHVCIFCLHAYNIHLRTQVALVPISTSRFEGERFFCPNLQLLILQELDGFVYIPWFSTCQIAKLGQIVQSGEYLSHLGKMWDDEDVRYPFFGIRHKDGTGPSLL